MKSRSDFPLKICSAQLRLIPVFQKSQQARSSQQHCRLDPVRMPIPGGGCALHEIGLLKISPKQNPQTLMRSLAYSKQNINFFKKKKSDSINIYLTVTTSYTQVCNTLILSKFSTCARFSSSDCGTYRHHLPTGKESVGS